MSIMIAMLVPIMLILILLYCKLGQLRKENMHIDTIELLSGSTHGGSSDQDSTENKKDGTEKSELLALENKSLESGVTHNY